MCRSIAEGGRRCPSSGGGSSLLSTGRSPSVRPPRLREKPRKVGTPIAPQAPLNPSALAGGTGSDAGAGAGNSSSTPHYDRLLSITSDEWYSLPWKERKAVSEEACREVIALTGSTATFRGWNRKTRSLGVAWYHKDYLTGEEIRSIELSDTANRHSEPITIADTIAHEVAHTLSSSRAGHGPEWEENFTKVKQQVGLQNELTSTHKATEAEQVERVKAFLQKKANAPWRGSCPQGHPFTAGRKPTRQHACVKCSRLGLNADITYERNTSRKGA